MTMAAPAHQPRTPCRSCGSTATPIVYGLPSDAAMAAAQRGEVRLGGCALPHWPTCRRCGNLVEETGRPRLAGIDLPVPGVLARFAQALTPDRGDAPRR